MAQNGRLSHPDRNPVLVQQKLDGSQRRFGHFAEEKILVPLMGIEHRLVGCPARIVIAIQAMLSQLPLHNAMLINS